MRARCGTGEELTEAGVRKRETSAMMGGNLVKGQIGTAGSYGHFHILLLSI